MPLIPHMTDQEIKEYLSEHDEEGFQDLPDWLRTELQARSLTFQRRDPTPQEMKETEQDAEEHRILNNERTIKDITKQCLLRRTRNDFQSQ